MEECRCDPAIGRVLRLMTKKEEREAKKLEKLRLEKERMYEMFSFEREYGNHQAICGIDEVGRGPFAGPVVAAAVILPKDCDILYLNDSKKLSEKKRELLYDEIYEKAVAIGIGMSSEEVIDEINILQATYKAMQQAISKLSIKPDLLLNDAVTIPDVEIEQMKEYDIIYPGCDFAKNKGYGTKAHIEGIKKQGICDIHRRTFVKKYI